MNSKSTLTPARGCGEAWLDLMHTCERLFRAGLRCKLGPTSDLRAAYRQWYAEQMREHDELLVRTSQRLHAAEANRSHAS